VAGTPISPEAHEDGATCARPADGVVRTIWSPPVNRSTGEVLAIWQGGT